MADVYDEELTEEEQAAFDEAEGVGGVTAAEPDDEPSEEGEQNPDVNDAAPSDDSSQAGAADADEYQEFLRKHQGKSPDELARLAFDQEKRASRTAFEQRQANKKFDEIKEAARLKLEERKAAVAADREKFEKDLAEDPDAATKMLADRLFSADEAAAQAEAERVQQEAAIADAIDFAGQYIPDLQQRAGSLSEFGQSMGFSYDELNGITDGRQLVILDLAEIAGRLMMTGAIDRKGNLVGTHPASVESSDPRLNGNAPPRSVSSVGGAPRAARSNQELLAEALGMTDKDFDNLSEDDLNKILGL